MTARAGLASLLRQFGVINLRQSSLTQGLTEADEHDRRFSKHDVPRSSRTSVARPAAPIVSQYGSLRQHALLYHIG